jgi:hypothetical protein
MSYYFRSCCYELILYDSMKARSLLLNDMMPYYLKIRVIIQLDINVLMWKS